MHTATLGEGDPGPGSGPETGRSTPARGQPQGRAQAADLAAETRMAGESTAWQGTV